MTELVDWDLAVRLGARIAGQGPEVSVREANEAVAELRAGAHRATTLVRDFTGLDATAGTAPVLVIDRASWVQANADGFAAILEPIMTRIVEGKGAPGGIPRAIGSRVTGSEIGALLGFLSSRVLGQFDPFFEPSGRLLLVAPNIVHVERQLKADPHDFRLWVCLHEETHRVQFTANPWLRDHLKGLIESLADSMEPSKLLDGGAQRFSQAIRGEASLVELFSTPEQQQILDRVTGVMSLLEGHADVVMDGVGPSVIASVATIRSSFTQRRQGVGMIDRVLRKLLGMEAKMAQYRDGAAYVRHIVDKVGMAEFNAVFTGPEALPTKAEISDPAAWISRVL